LSQFEYIFYQASVSMILFGYSIFDFVLSREQQAKMTIRE